MHVAMIWRPDSPRIDKAVVMMVAEFQAQLMHACGLIFGVLAGL